MTSCTMCEKLITEDEFLENDGQCKECLGPDDDDETEVEGDDPSIEIAEIDEEEDDDDDLF